MFAPLHFKRTSIIIFLMYKLYVFACYVPVIILFILIILTGHKRNLTMLKFLWKSVANLF